MQTLASIGERIGRIVCFVPRWIPEGVSLSGMPYKVFPVISALASHGLAVDLFTEVHDDLEGDELGSALRGCDGALAWCAEMNPGTQIPGLCRFLERARQVAPRALRLAGGGFFYLLPKATRRIPGLADEVLDDHGVPSAAERFREHIDARGGTRFERPSRPYPTRAKLDPRALYELDLLPFAKPEGLLFDNDKPTLQLPTGFGCAKRCAFCFYENTKVALLPAVELVDLVAHVRARYGIDQVLLGELDAFASRKRIVEFARLLVERDLGVRWFALASIRDVERLDDSELDTIAASGCHALELGTEVGSQDALRIIGKRYEVPAAVRSSVRLDRRGIVPVHNVMFGFAGETSRHRRDTLRQVERIRRASPRSKFNFRIYQAVPNTTMGDAVLAQTLPFPDSLLGLAEWRAQMMGGRAMPWLEPRAEADVRALTDYYLPFAYDDGLQDRRPGWLRRMLRRMARLRCRTGVLSLPIDRWLFDRYETVGLPGTFLP